MDLRIVFCINLPLPFPLSSRANNPKGLLEVREALEKVHKVEDLLPIMKVSLLLASQVGLEQ
jgi:hypothetical protein